MDELDDDLTRGYGRWRALEDEGREDDADAAFAPVFRRAMADQPVSLAFTARAMAAVNAAAERDLRRAQRTRKVLVPLGAAAAAGLLYASGGFLASAMATSVMWVMNLLVDTVVGAAKTADTGIDLWSLASSLGRAAAAFMSSPAVTISIIAIQGIAMLALIALQRLLGSDREFYQ
jgi:hypothetical protein